MSQPKAYAPVPGQQFQLFTRLIPAKEWEHCDYAENWATLKDLLKNYREAYGPGFQFRTIVLPQKYWRKK